MMTLFRGKRPLNKKLKNSQGFTLIEIMVVLGIIAVAYGAFVMFGFGGKSLLRQESQRLMQTIRYTYQLASAQGLYYRIVFNLEDGTYTVESSDDPVFVEVEPEDPDDEDEEDEEDSDDDSSFGEADDDLLDVYELDEDAKIYSVYVDHQRDARYSDKAYLNFFPRGYTQFAVIQISDLEEDKALTLQVNPVTGVITVYDGFKDHLEILEEIVSE